MLRLLTALLLISITSTAQTIDENKTDEFTGARIVSTNWEWLSYYGGSATIHFRIRVVDDVYYMHIKYMLSGGGVFAIGAKDRFMLKLTNDTVVKLLPMESQVSCRGCGAVGLAFSNLWGTDTQYELTPDVMELLVSANVVKTRMYISDGYVEQDVNSKRQDYILKALKLLHGRR